MYGHNHMQTFDGATYRSGAHACTYPLALKKGLEVIYTIVLIIHEVSTKTQYRKDFIPYLDSGFVHDTLPFQSFVVYGTFKAESESGTLASSLTYVSLFDLKNKLR